MKGKLPCYKFVVTSSRLNRKVHKGKCLRSNMVTLDTHHTKSITVTKKVYDNFILHEIVGTDMNGRETTVQFFSHDLDLVMGETVTVLRE